jgi:hypothetical protein
VSDVTQIARPRQGTSPTKLSDWLRQLAADHDGPALIVAKAVASIMVDASSDHWIALRRVCEITGLPSDTVAGILYRLRQRGRLGFDRRGPELRAEFHFTIPTDTQPIVERERVWNTKRPDPVAIPAGFVVTKLPPGKPPRPRAYSKRRAKWAVRRAMKRRA